MIPKTIHYVWLGDNKKPHLVKKCIASWKKVMPDFQLLCWNEENSPVDVPFVKEAISVGKYAFPADYIRLYALYNRGGVYMDTDVFARKSFNDFCSNSFFTGIEFNEEKFTRLAQESYLNSDGTKKMGDQIIQGLTVQSAIIGSEKENKIIKDCMEYYESNHFILEDGSYNYKFLAPDLIARVLEKYGFRYKNEFQNLSEDGAVVYPTRYFASGVNFQNDENYAVHCYTSSWQDASLLGKMIRKGKYLIKGLKLK